MLLTFKQKIIFGFAFVGILLTVVGYFFHISLNNIERAYINIKTEALPVQRNADEIQAIILNYSKNANAIYGAHNIKTIVKLSNKNSKIKESLLNILQRNKSDEVVNLTKLNKQALSLISVSETLITNKTAFLNSKNEIKELIALQLETIKKTSDILYDLEALNGLSDTLLDEVMGTVIRIDDMLFKLSELTNGLVHTLDKDIQNKHQKDLLFLLANIQDNYNFLSRQLSTVDSGNFKSKFEQNFSLFTSNIDKPGKLYQHQILQIEKRNEIELNFEKIEALSEKINTSIKKIKQQANETVIHYQQIADLKIENSKVLLMVVAVVFILVGGVIAYIFSDIIRSLGGEPHYAAKICNQVAKGNLSLQIKLNNADKQSLLFSISNMQSQLAEILNKVSTATFSVSSASSQINMAAQEIARGASVQAASIEETSASMEQMSASIEQNNENARATNSIAQKNAEDASSVGNEVFETVDAMKQIAKRVGVIDDIAYQTNLLALNAAIEAGRAGEYGKGFAVVASEVRKLAERSQIAAQEIGELAKNSVKRAEKAGQSLNEIVPSISRTADLMQEIASISAEQATGVSEINQAISQISQTLQVNAAASEQLSATSEEMNSHALHLQQSVSYFVLANGKHTSDTHTPKQDKLPRKTSATNDFSGDFDHYSEF